MHEVDREAYINNSAVKWKLTCPRSFSVRACVFVEAVRLTMKGGRVDQSDIVSDRRSRSDVRLTSSGRHFLKFRMFDRSDHTVL